METNKENIDITKGKFRESFKTGKRRSSILKVPRSPKTALQDVGENKIEKDKRGSRRVSFADTFQVKELVYNHNGTTEVNFTQEVKDNYREDIIDCSESFPKKRQRYEGPRCFIPFKDEMVCQEDSYQHSVSAQVTQELAVNLQSESHLNATGAFNMVCDELKDNMVDPDITRYSCNISETMCVGTSLPSEQIAHIHNMSVYPNNCNAEANAPLNNSYSFLTPFERVFNPKNVECKESPLEDLNATKYLSDIEETMCVGGLITEEECNTMTNKTLKLNKNDVDETFISSDKSIKFSKDTENACTVNNYHEMPPFASFNEPVSNINYVEDIDETTCMGIGIVYENDQFGKFENSTNIGPFIPRNTSYKLNNKKINTSHIETIFQPFQKDENFSTYTCDIDETTCGGLIYGHGQSSLHLEAAKQMDETCSKLSNTIADKPNDNEQQCKINSKKSNFNYTETILPSFQKNENFSTHSIDETTCCGLIYENSQCSLHLEEATKQINETFATVNNIVTNEQNDNEEKQYKVSSQKTKSNFTEATLHSFQQENSRTCDTDETTCGGLIYEHNQYSLPSKITEHTEETCITLNSTVTDEPNHNEEQQYKVNSQKTNTNYTKTSLPPFHKNENFSTYTTCDIDETTCGGLIYENGQSSLHSEATKQMDKTCATLSNTTTDEPNDNEEWHKVNSQKTKSNCTETTLHPSLKENFSTYTCDIDETTCGGLLYEHSEYSLQSKITEHMEETYAMLNNTITDENEAECCETGIVQNNLNKTICYNDDLNLTTCVPAPILLPDQDTTQTFFYDKNFCAPGTLDTKKSTLGDRNDAAIYNLQNISEEKNSLCQDVDNLIESHAKSSIIKAPIEDLPVVSNECFSVPIVSSLNILNNKMNTLNHKESECIHNVSKSTSGEQSSLHHQDVDNFTTVSNTASAKPSNQPNKTSVSCEHVVALVNSGPDVRAAQNLGCSEKSNISSSEILGAEMNTIGHHQDDAQAHKFENSKSEKQLSLYQQDADRFTIPHADSLAKLSIQQFETESLLDNEELPTVSRHDLDLTTTNSFQCNESIFAPLISSTEILNTKLNKLNHQDDTSIHEVQSKECAERSSLHQQDFDKFTECHRKSPTISTKEDILVANEVSVVSRHDMDSVAHSFHHNENVCALITSAEISNSKMSMIDHDDCDHIHNIGNGVCDKENFVHQQDPDKFTKSYIKSPIKPTNQSIKEDAILDDDVFVTSKQNLNMTTTQSFHCSEIVCAPIICSSETLDSKMNMIDHEDSAQIHKFEKNIDGEQNSILQQDGDKFTKRHTDSLLTSTKQPSKAHILCEKEDPPIISGPNLGLCQTVDTTENVHMPVTSLEILNSTSRVDQDCASVCNLDSNLDDEQSPLCQQDGSKLAKHEHFSMKPENQSSKVVSECDLGATATLHCSENASTLITSSAIVDIKTSDIHYKDHVRDNYETSTCNEKHFSIHRCDDTFNKSHADCLSKPTNQSTKQPEQSVNGKTNKKLYAHLGNDSTLSTCNIRKKILEEIGIGNTCCKHGLFLDVDKPDRCQKACKVKTESATAKLCNKLKELSKIKNYKWRLSTELNNKISISCFNGWYDVEISLKNHDGKDGSFSINNITLQSHIIGRGCTEELSKYVQVNFDRMSVRHSSLENPAQFLEDLSSFLCKFHPLVIDLRHVEVAHVVEFKDTLLTVMFASRHVYQEIAVTFTIDFDLYPNSVVHFKYQHIGGKSFSEDILQEAVRNILPGKNYLWRVVAAVDNALRN